MKISLGRDIQNRKVVAVNVGETVISHIHIGNQQIYPDSDVFVKRVQVELPAEGTLEWAYWVHAISAVNNNANDSCYMKVKLGGREYTLNKALLGCNKVELDLDVFVFDSDDGVERHLLKEGDEVNVYAVVPSITDEWLGIATQDGSGEKLYELPYLPDTHVKLKWGKGQKQKSAGVNFKLRGDGSGTLHIGGYGQKNGHDRGVVLNGDAAPKKGDAVQNGSVTSASNKYVDGDKRLKLWLDGYNSAYSIKGRPMYPAFTREWQLKIKAIV